MRLTDEQLSMVLGNATEHFGRRFPAKCSCVGAVALGYLSFSELEDGECKRGNEISLAIIDVAVSRNVEANALYATPDTLLGALEEAGLA